MPFQFTGVELPHRWRAALCSSARRRSRFSTEAFTTYSDCLPDFIPFPSGSKYSAKNSFALMS